MCPFPGDVNFDHLVKVVSARFLHLNVTVFLIVVNKYPEGRYCKYLVFCHTFRPLFLSFITFLKLEVYQSILYLA